MENVSNHLFSLPMWQLLPTVMLMRSLLFILLHQLFKLLKQLFQSHKDLSLWVLDGGTTADKRVESIALDAELHGATAVVLNAPTTTEFIQNLAQDIDIPVVLTIVSLNEDLEQRMLHTGANIVNVSGGKDTVKIVKKLREISPDFPIIATGGPTEETVREVIQAGANAVTFTPPTNGEIFKGMMEEYRHRYD